MISKPKGTYDILPDDINYFKYIENNITKTCLLSNYKEIRTPIFEDYSLFHRDSNDSTDIVSKETYDFKDRSERLLTLRPEGTASIVRSLIENKLYSNNTNIKLFYYGPMFRYERQQKGRYRQFIQFGLEAFGSDSFSLDLDIILTGFRLLNNIGLKNVKLRINSLSNNLSRTKYKEELVKYFNNHYDNLCPDCKERIKKNPLRLLDCKICSEKEFFFNKPNIKDFITEESKEFLNNICNILEKRGYNFYISYDLVRGLDYYDETVFEYECILHDGKTLVIGGGGRYNSLVSDLKGPELHACGLAFGVDRLVLVLKEENILIPNNTSLDIFIMCLDKECLPDVILLMNFLRDNNYKVDIDYKLRNIKAQFKESDYNMSKINILIGLDEIKNGIYTIKNNITKKQDNIKQNDLLKYLKENL